MNHLCSRWYEHSRQCTYLSRWKIGEVLIELSIDHRKPMVMCLLIQVRKKWGCNKYMISRYLVKWSSFVVCRPPKFFNGDGGEDFFIPNFPYWAICRNCKTIRTFTCNQLTRHYFLEIIIFRFPQLYFPLPLRVVWLLAIGLPSVPIFKTVFGTEYRSLNVQELFLELKWDLDAKTSSIVEQSWI